MTDKQLEKLYSNISDFKEFMSKVNSKQDITTDKFKVHFNKSQTVDIIVDDRVEQVSWDNFEKIKTDLFIQWENDKRSNEIKKNKIYDSELNIRDNKTFIVTDKFIESLIHGREIASGYYWYIDQIKQISKLFVSEYKLLHNDRQINNQQEFVDRYLKRLSGFESIEKELE